MWMIISIFSKVLNIFSPPLCLGCKTDGKTLCDNCLKRCRKAIDTPALWIISLYDFQDPLIKRAIHSIKYFHRRDLIEPLAETLSRELKNYNFYNSEENNLILVPIPMPKLRKYIRGYNQAELIACELSKNTKLAYRDNLLMRIKNTKRQAKISSRKDRINNQKNSFYASKDVMNLNILLVDDVTTTGATLSEARDTLIKAGAISVRAITIAH